MCTLDIKIKEMKGYLRNKDINKIRKLKLNEIKSVDSYTIEKRYLLSEYNYYIKLLKSIKNYVKSNINNYILLDVDEDKDKRLVGILLIINLEYDDIGIPIKIILLSGNSNKSCMECTCFEVNKGSTLYIDNFRSRMSNKGYGKILLTRLEKEIININKVLKKNNIQEIISIEGLVSADKNIIKESDLINLYRRYGFEVDKYNNLYKSIK